MDEIYYCGQCRRQQLPSKGIPCIVCGKTTVSWYINRESEQEVLHKWKRWNGE